LFTYLNLSLARFDYLGPDTLGPSSSDPDLAGSYAAMERAARSAQDLAIRTNTGIVVAVDEKLVELTAADLIVLREQETAGN